MDILPGQANLWGSSKKLSLACIIAVQNYTQLFIMNVALNQHHVFKPFGRPPRCKLQSYSQIDYTMLEPMHSSLTKSLKNAPDFSSIHKSISTPCLSISRSLEEEFDTNSRIEIIAGNGAPRVRALVVEVVIAMASGVNPEPVSTGLGGAYFMRSKNGNTIAIAKPIDEEPLAFNNPKGFAGRMLGQPGLKHSIRIGETGFRELAAYVLDHGGFAGVPPTALVRMPQTKFNVNSSESISAPPYKIASLQRFVDHDSDAGDLGPSSFSVSSIHRIGILDIRLLNLDRHAGNILVKKGQDVYSSGVAELVPIDHGFCLPESLDDPYFEWLHWPQALIPFSESEIEYISSLDPFKDAKLLKKMVPSIRESSIRILVICTIFLKHTADFGMCLADIGEMMTRKFHGGQENWSAFENLCMNAKTSLSWRLIDDLSCDQVEEDIEVLQFDDSNDISWYDLHCLQNCPLTGKPTKIPRSSSERLIAKLSNMELLILQEEDSCENDDNNSDEHTTEECEKENESACENHRLSGVLMRSMSFAVPNHSNDNREINLGYMSNKEWELFLEIFHDLLPQFIEERKRMSLSKQRLATSCEF
ncbi:hypothetical protein ACH5RR_006941 [Cinchona calisaya]|uniref:1-phosphatidylinositol 4-kinase n=1 Tax=Cinchona calisaya TaxID=153742 RepID=A0ABD3AQI5_9GENT